MITRTQLQDKAKNSTQLYEMRLGSTITPPNIRIRMLAATWRNTQLSKLALYTSHYRYR